jgi:hypothetical protein
MQLKCLKTFQKRRSLEEDNDGERNRTYSFSYSHGEILNPTNHFFE